MRRAVSIAAILLTLARAATPAGAQPAEPFYKDKRISIVVASAAGSGYDAYARLMSRHWGKHIPGNPSFVVQNMPGGGGLQAANHLYNVAAGDGTTVGLLQRGLIISPLVEPSNVNFDVSKLKWLGSTTAETGVLAVWHTAPHKKYEDMLTQELIIGGSGPATDSETFPRVYNAALGTKIRIVGGYQSSAPVMLAMERGEVQGVGNSSYSNWKTQYARYVEAKQVRFLVQAGLTKNAELPDVPNVLDLAKTPQARQMLELFLAPNTIGRPFAAPPNTPQDRFVLLRNSFEATLKDKEFLAEADKSKQEISPVTGQYIEDTLKRLYATPPEVVEAARKAIESGVK